MNIVMKRILIMALLLGLALSSCVPGEGPLSPPQSSLPVAQASQTLPPPLPVIETRAPLPAEETPGAVPGEDTPEGVALRFYEAYREASEKREPTLGNPEFAAEKYLSAEYLKQVAEIQAGFEGAGFDPVLQAQNTPPQPVEVKESQVEGDQATVVLQFGRGLMETPWERKVALEKIEGAWKLVPDLVEGGGLSPVETVRAFYTWYLGYVGSGKSLRNPLADRAYRAAPYLSAEVISKVDRMAEEGDFAYDPLLCAQDVPADVNPIASFANASRPVVVMSSNLPGHILAADLVRSNFNTWSIRKITCGSSLEGLAKAFYTWTLDYMSGSGEFRNPWVDGAYMDSPFLSQAYIQSLQERLDSGEPLAADPVLLAQDLPQAFNTTACAEPHCALVNLQYGENTFHQLRLDLEMENGLLRITGIQSSERPQIQEVTASTAGVENWVSFIDEPYGYALRYPSNWQVHTSPVTDLHTPDENPMMRQVTFQAPGQGKDAVAYQLEVRVESEESIAQFYPADSKVGEVEISGNPATVYRSDPGFLYYVIRHPGRENIWIILTDPVAQFPGREALAEQTGKAFQVLLSTITLIQEG